MKHQEILKRLKEAEEEEKAGELILLKDIEKELFNPLAYEKPTNLKPPERQRRHYVVVR